MKKLNKGGLNINKNTIKFILEIKTKVGLSIKNILINYLKKMKKGHFLIKKIKLVNIKENIINIKDLL